LNPAAIFVSLIVKLNHQIIVINIIKVIIVIINVIKLIIVINVI
jgi:hypothetical protein